MTSRACRWGAITALLFAGAVGTPGAAFSKEAKERPLPTSRRGEAVDVLHGETIPDPYRWMEHDEAPEVIAWDKAQDDYARAYLEACPDREILAQRFAEEFGQTSIKGIPTFEAGRRWYLQRAAGANHAVLYVTDPDDTLDTPRVVLDPNTWSEDATVGMNQWFVSPTGSHVAYLRDEKGSEASTLHIRDIVTGTDLPEVITRAKFSSVLWDEDGKGFLYHRLPDPESVPAAEAQHHRRTFHHTLGDRVIDDLPVYGRHRPAIEFRHIYRSSDRKHVFLLRGMPYREHEVFELLRDGDQFSIRPVITGLKDRTYVDRIGDRYVLSSDRENPKRAIYVAPVQEDGRPGPWRELAVPRSQRGVVDRWEVLDERYVVIHVRDNVVSKLYVHELIDEGAPAQAAVEIKLPCPGVVGRTASRPGDTRLWFSFQAMSVPTSRMVVDVSRADPVPVAEEQTPTTVDLSQLVSEQLSYTSKDGTEVPLLIVRHKDTDPSKAACVLYGYGGFNVGMQPRFSRTRALFAAEGGMYVLACLRGGNEYGEAWHEAGARANKQNVFDDFIAAADFLVRERGVDRKRLAIQGGSNGGLLVATVINQRPDLCAAVVCGVPLTDMLRYHKFQFAKTWTMEYGNPDIAEEFAWIRPYSPYHNTVQGAQYPAILVTAGLHDGRVDAFHARKMVAAWQHASGGGAPILLRLDRVGGHGAASLKHVIEELVDEHAFLRKVLGPPGAAPQAAREKE